MSTAKYQSSVFLYAYLIMASGCIYYLFSFIENALFDLIGVGNPQKAGETIGYQIVWLALYLLLMLKLAKASRRIVSLTLSSGFLLAFLFAAIWSLTANDPNSTAVTKFVMYSLTIAFAAWLTTNSDAVDRVFGSLFRLGIVVLILHLLVYPLGSTINWDLLGRPTLIGTTPYGGLFGHKNLAGDFFAISSLVCFVKFLSPSCRNKILYIFLMFLHAVMVLLAGAMGALVALVASTALTFGVYLVIERKTFFALLYWMVIAGFAAVVELVDSSYFFELVGRGANLTGRDTIWAAAMLFFWEHPWLGYGYANFFESVERAQQFWSLMPYHAQIWSLDNSYLDILIQFGVIGGIFVGIILLKAIWAALRLAIADNSAHKIGPIALLSFVLISSIADSMLLLHNYLFCVIVFWSYFGLEGARQEKWVRDAVPGRNVQWSEAGASLQMPNLNG